jgi:hypothetical protein
MKLIKNWLKHHQKIFFFIIEIDRSLAIICEITQKIKIQFFTHSEFELMLATITWTVNESVSI